MSANTLRGSFTSSRIRSVASACHPTRSRSTTSPTVTSLTLTGDLGTSWRTSSNSAVTWKE